VSAQHSQPKTSMNIVSTSPGSFSRNTRKQTATPSDTPEEAYPSDGTVSTVVHRQRRSRRSKSLSLRIISRYSDLSCVDEEEGWRPEHFVLAGSNLVFILKFRSDVGIYNIGLGVRGTRRTLTNPVVLCVRCSSDSRVSRGVVETLGFIQRLRGNRHRASALQPHGHIFFWVGSTYTPSSLARAMIATSCGGDL